MFGHFTTLCMKGLNFASVQNIHRKTLVLESLFNKVAAFRSLLLFFLLETIFLTTLISSVFRSSQLEVFCKKNFPKGVLKYVMRCAIWFQPATLLKVTLLHGCFSRFLSCTNVTKSRNAPHMVHSG